MLPGKPEFYVVVQFEALRPTPSRRHPERSRFSRRAKDLREQRDRFTRLLHYLFCHPAEMPAVSYYSIGCFATLPVRKCFVPLARAFRSGFLPDCRNLCLLNRTIE
jgi:hypothetical protein